MTAATEAAVLQDLAPNGVLRAAINFGNSVLAQRDGPAGVWAGVSVDLAHELGRRLGVPVELVGFDAAGQVVQALQRQAWDVAFLAIDPARATEILFTPPYVLIEGAYVVRDDSPLQASGDVDRAGVRVGAGAGSAYELFLSRHLQRATIERCVTAAEAYERLQNGELDAAGGVRQIVEALARRHGGLRVLVPSFMVIRQAMGTPVGRPAGAAFVARFI
jgi:polar amino acid transport system substrate-binding protein